MYPFFEADQGDQVLLKILGPQEDFGIAFEEAINSNVLSMCLEK